MDADYLTNDFFVNANETFGPRFYYSKFMALGSLLMGIQLWFLFLSVFCAFITAWYTFKTSYEIFKWKHYAAITAIFVLAMPTPTLAESTFFVYENIMTPSAFVFPMLVVAFYHFFARHQLVIPIVWVGIASFFQVLYGLTTGLLLIGTFVLNQFRFPSPWKYFPWAKLIFTLFVFGLFASASLIPYFSASVSSSMTTTEFVDIVAHFRNPHHYVPTYFPVQTWILAICFFGAGYLAYRENKQSYWNPEITGVNDTSQVDQFHPQSIIFSCLILFGFVLGYVFVEIYPSRLVTTAQTFRYVILLKWIICLYLGMRVPMLFAAHPVTSFVHTIITRIKAFAYYPRIGSDSYIRDEPTYKWLESKTGKRIMLVVKISALILPLLFLSQGKHILLLLSIFIFIVFFFFAEDMDSDYLKPIKYYTTSFMVITTIGLAISPFISQKYLPKNIDNLLSKVYPKYDFKYKYDDDLNELSQFIKAQTNEKATFIIPPYLSDIRFSANRAIVVDFKSIPYQDNALLEWRQRIRDCYGETNLQGFEAQEDLTAKFRNVKMSHLQNIQAKYNANYAIVETVNPIEENIIFKNDTYKLIQIE